MGGPGVLWSMESQRVGHDLMTKQQQQILGEEYEKDFLNTKQVDEYNRLSSLAPFPPFPH